MTRIRQAANGDLNRQEAMRIIAEIRSSIPNGKEYDRAAVILGSAWMYLDCPERFKPIGLTREA